MKIALTLLLCFGLLASLSAENQYAKNFSIEYKEGYKLLTVKNAFLDAGNTRFTYALVPRETNIPEEAKTHTIVRTPVERVVSLASPYLAYIHEIGMNDSVVGIGHYKYLYTQQILDNFRARNVPEVGGGMMPNVESIVALQPDVVFSSAAGMPDRDLHPMLEAVNIPVAIVGGYMEPHILGRTEWIKFMAAFYDKEKEMDEWFTAIVKNYEAAKKLAKNVENKPLITVNAPYGNSWFVPAGDSYMANMMKDAGGQYIWEDKKASGPIRADFESVYERALNADYWINVGQVKSMHELLNVDERFAQFKSVQNGKVYSNAYRTNEDGANDYWERGVVHPDEVLMDWIQMLHPELLPGRELFYYFKLQ